MSKFSWSLRACGIFLLWAATAVTLPAQTFTTLHSFNGVDGNLPIGALIQGTDGNLYGTTSEGGAHANAGFGGTVFNITPSGTLSTLYSFCAKTSCKDGQYPSAGLVQGSDGNFYGAAKYGGAHGVGTVFAITSTGMLTTLHTFHDKDGANPTATLVLGFDGNFYGTTFNGGAKGFGAVFGITASGGLTTLGSLIGKDGIHPQAGLVQGTNGNFYGTTYSGGTGQGTVFSITAGGTLTTLHDFQRTVSTEPTAGLILATNGNFYGTTTGGGPSNAGTVFEITPSGTLTTLYTFCSQTGCADGANPFAGLVQGSDGNFYGTTTYGGANTNSSCHGPNSGCGTVFEITPSGTLTTLYTFCSQTGCADGIEPLAGLVQDTNGTFYGAASTGGTGGYGTVFSLSVGLGPFVVTEPTSGVVGSAVNILGTNLTGATNVTFNGTAATFTVVSASEITTTVPTGATTGTVQVVPPGGTLSSNVPFTVN
jgi:uncharacterized repeat protein (TIGR03803 family)